MVLSKLNDNLNGVKVSLKTVLAVISLIIGFFVIVQYVNSTLDAKILNAFDNYDEVRFNEIMRHPLIVEMKANIDNITNDISEIKAEMKEMNNKLDAN